MAAERHIDPMADFAGTPETMGHPESDTVRCGILVIELRGAILSGCCLVSAAGGTQAHFDGGSDRRIDGGRLGIQYFSARKLAVRIVPGILDSFRAGVAVIFCPVQVHDVAR